jgi:uncharacterized phage protein (TIGR02216 family)
MQIGFSSLRLSPVEFWSMTLIEFNEACRGVARMNGYDTQAPITHDDLEELMRRFPDANNR